MKLVKFKEAGKWADSDTTRPQISVEAGEVCEVSLGLADIIVQAGKGEIVKPKPSAADKKAAADKAAKDKAAAESK